MKVSDWLKEIKEEKALHERMQDEGRRHRREQAAHIEHDLGDQGGIVHELQLIRKFLPRLQAGVYDYPAIANGPIEQVIAFNNNETITLEGVPNAPHFSSHGTLTDLQHNPINCSEVLTTFPVDPATLPGTILWPPAQVKPWNEPPVDNTNTTGNGYSKQYYSFNSGKDYFVTVGPSLPKIAKLKNGGAQFWVGSIGVMSQGEGRFKGGRGVSVYIGSAYLPEWPDDQNKQLAILQAGFEARIGTYFKFVPASAL